MTTHQPACGHAVCTQRALCAFGGEPTGIRPDLVWPDVQGPLCVWESSPGHGLVAKCRRPADVEISIRVRVHEIPPMALCIEHGMELVEDFCGHQVLHAPWEALSCRILPHNLEPADAQLVPEQRVRR